MEDKSEYEIVPLRKLWEKLYTVKQPLEQKYEKYAKWTLPYLYSPVISASDDLKIAPDSTGAQCVNNLANKLVFALFNPSNPFFRSRIDNTDLEILKEKAEKQEDGAAAILNELDKTLSKIEKKSMSLLDAAGFRTEAVTVAKQLIVLGNSLLYFPEKGKMQVYHAKDWVIRRDIEGNIIEFMTKDCKDLKAFDQKIQDALTEAKKKKKKDVTLYTHICLNDDGKYVLRQAVEDVELEVTGLWAKDDLPWIPLAWNLIRGEDYGRGLVEDYSGTFNGVEVLTNTLVTLIGLSADIKILVNPGCQTDVKEFNNSAPGTYLVGQEGDITYTQIDKQADIAAVGSAIETYKRQLAQAFLLNSSVIRDAERVTAEEVRFMVQELEMAHGGIYSRFSDEWQKPLARLLIARVDENLKDIQGLQLVIVTGMDALSRSGDLENLRMFISDLTLLQNVPDEIRAVIHPLRFAQYIATRRGVEYDLILKSSTEIAQEQQQAQAQQAAMIEQDAAGKVAVEAGKAAVQQE